MKISEQQNKEEQWMFWKRKKKMISLLIITDDTHKLKNKNDFKTKKKTKKRDFVNDVTRIQKKKKKKIIDIPVNLEHFLFHRKNSDFAQFRAHVYVTAYSFQIYFHLAMLNDDGYLCPCCHDVLDSENETKIYVLDFVLLVFR